MKIVQTFWSKPFLDATPDILNSGLNGGWPHRLIHYCSWAFSCLQLRKFYDRVELVTDDFGKELLVDLLQLPYTSVDLALNDLRDVDTKTWSMGKIYSYYQQKEPFLHVDGDIFIFDRFSQAIAGAPLVAQNEDFGYPGYDAKSGPVWEGFAYVPEYLREVYETKMSSCCNAGIFGGQDIQLIHAYAKEAVQFFEGNREVIHRQLYGIDAVSVNIIMEQSILYYYARSRGREFTYLFPEHKNNPPELGFFHAAEKNRQYVHCFGHYKSLRSSYATLALKLKTEYPLYYEKIAELVELSVA